MLQSSSCELQRLESVVTSVAVEYMDEHSMSLPGRGVPLGDVDCKHGSPG